MYGYQPPEQEPGGSWGEIFSIIWVVFGILLPPLLALFGVIALLGSAVWLLSIHPLLALGPVAILGLGVWWLVRRDKQEHQTLEEELFGKRRP